VRHTDLAHHRRVSNGPICYSDTKRGHTGFTAHIRGAVAVSLSSRARADTDRQRSRETGDALLLPRPARMLLPPSGRRAGLAADAPVPVRLPRNAGNARRPVISSEACAGRRFHAPLPAAASRIAAAGAPGRPDSLAARPTPSSHQLRPRVVMTFPAGAPTRA